MKITLQNAYTTLGVSHGASEEEARSAYRKLALKFHPDKNPDTDTTAKFQEISAAYKRICDHYKRQRTTGNQGSSFFDDDEDEDDFDDDEFAFDDIDLEDLELSFEEMMMMFEMMFGPAGHGKRKNKPTVNIKKTATNEKKAAAKDGASTAHKAVEAGVKVPVRAGKSRTRKGKRRGGGGMNDDDMAAAFASFMDPEMMMFEQFMGMSMEDPDMGGMDMEMMDEMMQMLGGDDPFGVKGFGKKRKGKKGTTAKKSKQKEEEIEEVSDWEDDPSESKAPVPRGGNQEDHTPQSTTIPLNSRVRITNKLIGTVKFVGPVHYTKGEFIGVQLDEPEGKNDGTIRGVAYFKCKPLHGIMVRPQEITIISTPTAE